MAGGQGAACSDRRYAHAHDRLLRSRAGIGDRVRVRVRVRGRGSNTPLQPTGAGGERPAPLIAAMTDAYRNPLARAYRAARILRVAAVVYASYKVPGLINWTLGRSNGAAAGAPRARPCIGAMRSASSTRPSRCAAC